MPELLWAVEIVELPMEGAVPVPQLPTKSVREKEQVEVKPVRPQSKFGAVDGLDDLFG